MATTLEAPHKFNTGGSTSTVDAKTGSMQLQQYWYQREALIELAKEQYFTQLADVMAMPKHYGKNIKQYAWIPLLDDRNKNDQGIDALGAKIAEGNLYGSSKDIGVIPTKIPTLTEDGGRVNRVGFSRRIIEGRIQFYGFFFEFTREALDFDTEQDLLKHMTREAMRGAKEISEALLQIDLINAAGVIRYTGSATNTATVADVVTYKDIVHLGIELDKNRCEKKTKMITGSRMVDTKTIPAARALYVGSELIPTLRAMVDYHGNPAFIPVQKYAASTEVMNGEIGSIDMFRIIVVPEMFKWAGAGDTDAPEFYSNGGKKDVFPMLAVGSGSFTTIGFQLGGGNNGGTKAKQITVMPGDKAASAYDPYGQKGFVSLQWYYGFMALHPEHIAIIKTAAKM